MTAPGKLGTVKFYNPMAGFGFIACDSGDEIYFHCTAIEEASKLLKPGDAVKFIVGFSRDGRTRARSVAVLQSVGSRN